MSTELRRIEVFVKDHWEERQGLVEVKKGELFRMFESDGSQVADGTRCEWIATSDGFIHETRHVGAIWVD